MGERKRGGKKETFTLFLLNLMMGSLTFKLRLDLVEESKKSLCIWGIIIFFRRRNAFGIFYIN